MHTISINILFRRIFEDNIFLGLKMILKWILRYWNYLSPVPILVLFNCFWSCSALRASAEYYTADINVTVLNPDHSAPTLLKLERGRYGQESPKITVKGLLLAPLPINGVANHLGCDPQTRFQVPPNTEPWIALLRRGNCTFRHKILRAVLQNASAVVIYNNVSSEEPVTMTHQGTGDIVAVMITELKVKEILNYLEKNMTVLIAIAVGTHYQNKHKNVNDGSLFFVSISLIVLMIIPSVLLIVCLIQKIRCAHD